MPQTLVIGVGSPIGDDRLGWLATELIRQRELPGVATRLVAAPVELTHVSGTWDCWVVIDACIGGDPVQSIQCFDWPDDRMAAARFSGTHDLGLVDALRLAESLHALPRRVRIVAGAVAEGSLSLDVSTAARDLADRIGEFVVREVSKDTWRASRHA